MAKINYSAAEVEDILTNAEALYASVPPRITHTRASSATTPPVSISTLAEMQTWLESLAADIAAYGVRFVSVTTSGAFSMFRSATYAVMIFKGSNANAFNCIFFSITGAKNSSTPAIFYMRRVSGAWESPVTIAE